MPSLHREIVVEAGVESHNVNRIRKKPGWPPLVVQRGDPAANEVRPDHLKGESGLGEPKNPGGGDGEPPIGGVDITDPKIQRGVPRWCREGEVGGMAWPVVLD